MHPSEAAQQPVFTVGRRFPFHPPARARWMGIIALVLLLAAGNGLCAEPNAPVWTMPELRAMEKNLRENGLKIREFVEKPGTRESDRELCLDFDAKNAREDFAAFARLTQGKIIPRLAFAPDASPGGCRILWDSMPDLSALQCAYLGLDLPFAPNGADLKPLRDVACLKRLFTDTDNLEMLPDLPQVEELFLQGRALYSTFSPELIPVRFPNLTRLTLHDSVPFFDFSSFTPPASLTEVANRPANDPGEEYYKDVLSAYRLNTAKKIPSIRRINGIPAGEFDPLANLSPAQREQYAALPGYIRVESSFREQAPSQRHTPQKDVTLRGKILVYEAGAYTNMVYDGDNQALHAALADAPEKCDTLLIYERTFQMMRPSKYFHIGGSDYSIGQSLYLMDRQKNELTLVWARMTQARAAKHPDPWEKIEELFMQSTAGGRQ